MLATPESVGLSSAQLAKIDVHLKRNYIDPGKIAGCLTLVHRGGETVYLSALGQRDRERNLPMEEDTIVRIYSMTKPLTSIALMSFFEEGRFQLNDPVAKFIPEFANLEVYESGVQPSFITQPARTPMTIKHLLTHMSGLTYGFMLRTNVDAAYRKLKVGERPGTTDLQGMIEQLAGLPLEFEPGSAWNYSVATDVCGYLVQKLADKPFAEVLHERILKPLGMVDTDFFVPADKVDRFAANYHRGRDRSLKLLDDPRSSSYLVPPLLPSGGGGLVSTAGDYLKFCRMLLEGGSLDGERIIGPRTLELMTQNHLPDDRDLTELSVGAFSETAYEGNGFGLGFSVTLDPVLAAGHGSAGDFGWGGMASTIFWVDPEEDLTVIFLTQFVPSGTFNFRAQLKSIIYSAIVD